MNRTALLKLASEDPYWHFEADELSAMFNLSATTFEMLKRADDTPFVTGKARPEQVLKWLASHPAWKPSTEK